ncbi:MAG: RpiB/LacA/LacB family sugar-phosphate isomerase [Parcubacteria group bacterium]
MIYLASDHRGYELKAKIKEWLTEWRFGFEDMGPDSYDKDDDYPDFVSLVGVRVSEDPVNSKGIVLGRSGQAEAIVANKYKNVRAVVYYGGDADLIRLSREDNDANVLSLGAGFLDEENAKAMIKLWLDTEFSNQERHKRRIDKISKIEQQI